MLPATCSQPLLMHPALSSPHLQKINSFSSPIFFLKHSQRISPLTWPLSYSSSQSRSLNVSAEARVSF